MSKMYISLSEELDHASCFIIMFQIAYKIEASKQMFLMRFIFNQINFSMKETMKETLNNKILMATFFSMCHDFSVNL